MSVQPTSFSLPLADHPSIYVLHENEEWLVPLRQAFNDLHIPFQEWFLHEGRLPLDQEPPQGVFYNRMSASSHTRGHRYSAEFTAPVLAWLEAHGRRVVNGRRALQLEIGKAEQYLQLQAHGVRVPRTVVVSGREQLLQAAREFDERPFIVKPNRGGRGLGVQLFHTVEELSDSVPAIDELSLDGLALVQQYVKPAHGTITRLEFIGGRFFYAVQVDATDGFELCPADSCTVDDAFCPAPGQNKPNKFTLDAGFSDPDLIRRLEAFFADNHIEVGAAEFVEAPDGARYVYDVNVNTNYNQQAEKEAGNDRRAMHRLASFLRDEL
ncbi:MAG: ATP-grasp domain-containing protein, partial [Balneolaceae bacterium]